MRVKTNHSPCKKNMWSHFAATYLQSIFGSKGKNIVKKNEKWLPTSSIKTTLDKMRHWTKREVKHLEVWVPGQIQNSSATLRTCSDILIIIVIHHHLNFRRKTNHEKSMSKLTCSISLSSSSLIKCIYIYLTFINPDRIRQNMPASIVRKSSLYHTPSPPSPFPPSPLPPFPRPTTIINHQHQMSYLTSIFNISRTYLSSSSSSPELEEHFRVLTYTFSSYASTM